jgi:hypothetical protein
MTMSDESFEMPPSAPAPAPDFPTDEEASKPFLPPPEGETSSEVAAFSEPGEGVLSVSPSAMAVKQAIEDWMCRSVPLGPGIQALDATQGPGVIQGVALGLAEDSGAANAAPGEPAVTVYVAEPTSLDRVKAAVVDTMGVQAAAADDLPMQVVVTGAIDAQPHRFKLRPAPGGISVGHYRITAGTIGCLARGRTAPRRSRLLVLSNNHVLANSNNAVFGDSILQPGPYDGGINPRDRIAILERFVPIDFSGRPNYVDCATGWAWPDLVRKELVRLVGGNPAFFRIGSLPVNPVLGMVVGKSGRTTQLTQGRISAIGATIRVNYGAGRVALFQDQIEIRGTSGLFSSGGDSGSSIWTWNPQRNPVGLLFAGGGSSTFANRFTRVLQALDVSVVA